MNKILNTVVLLAMFCVPAGAQNLIQGTIKNGTLPNQVDIYMKPNFTSNNYIYQYQFPIAFPASASPVPTITFAKDATFTAVEETGGSSYTVSVYPLAHNTANTVRYYVISLVRNGSNNYLRASGVEYKVGTVTFHNSSTPPQSLVKLADFQDGGSDGQGNFYTVDGLNNYYVTSNSAGNFYAAPAQSTAGGTLSDGYAQTISTVTLPVQLTAFSAVKASDGVRSQLDWTTATEAGSDYFEVERSSADRSGSFAPIGVRMQGQGTSAAEHSYQTYDRSPLSGDNWYRLRMVDLSGRVSYSESRLVRFAARSMGESVLLYPNPVRRESAGAGGVHLQVQATSAQRVSYTITDGGGRLVGVGEVGVSAGSGAYPLEGIEALAAGTYYLNAKGTTINAQLKFTKTQ